VREVLPLRPTQLPFSLSLSLSVCVWRHIIDVLVENITEKNTPAELPCILEVRCVRRIAPHKVSYFSVF